MRHIELQIAEAEADNGPLSQNSVEETTELNSDDSKKAVYMFSRLQIISALQTSTQSRRQKSAAAPVPQPTFQPEISKKSREMVEGQRPKASVRSPRAICACAHF